MLNIILGFVFSFIITYITIPSIIRIAGAKHLYDVPDERSSHDTIIPTLGGLAIFIGFILSITFWTDFTLYPSLQYLEFALVTVFFLGIKDDIIAISPLYKTIGILIASCVLSIWGDVRISSFSGMFGIYELPYWISIAFTIFVIFTIINAFNLIDGINGLCSSSGIITSASFGVWFFLVGGEINYQRVIIIACLIGSLIAFLRYNITPARIFMGDTGSLILGLLLAFFTIEFLEENIIYHGVYKINSAPIVAMGFMALPLVDMAKVFIIRLYNKKSPFYPDRNHIHHLLLKLGLSHTKATILLSIISMSFIIIVLMLQDVNKILLTFLVTFLATAISLIPNYLLWKKEKNK
jgi:UDP-GlcNAc:undecaprenyl-phosphate/decaprenyl-phosphate GlcNAc-1-phosphate transferase